MNATTQIKDQAREIGFDKVGIASAGPAPGGGRLDEWLHRGYQAGMVWMARNRDRRTDVREVLPGAKSVICLAVNYYTPHELAPNELKISRYAWGLDYHHLLSRMCKDLTRRIENDLPESKNLWYVDTGPVLEKAWAQEAGLGWIGKNDVLISRDFGSWLFLGEIITTLELEPDSPASDHCGTCTKCIEACPTEAIVEPYVVDSGRCISYLTIEHRGDWPPETAGRTDGWVFGCDICQDVCPFNRFGRETGFADEFNPREGILQATTWQGIDQENFVRLTQKSPLRRAKHEGMSRNLRAAGIGNSA